MFKSCSLAGAVEVNHQTWKEKNRQSVS